MPAPTLEQTLSALRLLVRGARRRPPRPGEAAPLLARLLQSARTVAIEPRAGGMAFRFEAHESEGARCLFTCVIEDAGDSPLTPSEREEIGRASCRERVYVLV